MLIEPESTIYCKLRQERDVAPPGLKRLSKLENYQHLVPRGTFQTAPQNLFRSFKDSDLAKHDTRSTFSVCPAYDFWKSAQNRSSAG